MIIRDKQEKKRIYTYTHVPTSYRLKNWTKEINILVFVQSPHIVYATLSILYYLYLIYLFFFLGEREREIHGRYP